MNCSWCHVLVRFRTQEPAGGESDDCDITEEREWEPSGVVGNLRKLATETKGAQETQAVTHGL